MYHKPGLSVKMLINKRGENSDISNWCPISLSNTTAKLYSSQLANHVAQSADKALKGINFKLQMISKSLLAPGQILDAINTFILPCVSFHLKYGAIQKGPLNMIDRDIKVSERDVVPYRNAPELNPLNSVTNQEA